MITIEGYTREGFKLTFSLPCNTVEEGLRHLRNAVEAGVTPQPQDPDALQTETIATVVRREHIGKNNQVTPVIDFYPAWKGDYGQFRFCGVYLNTPQDIADFESHAGVKLSAMPLYDAQAPLQRNQSRRHRAEVTCKPFEARKAADGEKDINGTIQTVWKFTGYGSSASEGGAVLADKPLPSQTQAAVKSSGPVWWEPLKKKLNPSMSDENFERALDTARRLFKQNILQHDTPIEDVYDAVIQGTFTSDELLEDEDAARFAAKETLN